MKKQHIVAIVMIAVALAVVISLINGGSSYGDFETATKNPDTHYDIVGVLDTTEAVVYNVLEDADRFSFYMIDNSGKRSHVIVKQAKPQDFEKSVNVVVGGKMEENSFVATKVLMKCPSKYEGEGTPPEFIKQGEYNEIGA
jgi:cytochrome c-type biogenesis protein CcmE